MIFTVNSLYPFRRFLHSSDTQTEFAASVFGVPTKGSLWMRRFVTATALVAVLAVSACAYSRSAGGGGGSGRQQHSNAGNSAGNVDDQIENLSKQLDLTSSQKSKIKNILQDQANEFDALQKNTSLSHDEKKTKGEEYRKKTLERVRAVLNPDQQKKLDDMHLKGIKKKQRLESSGT